MTVDRILATVSKTYGISTEDIKAKKRTSSIVNARHVCIYLIRQLTDLSFSAIGEIFGRDHATIMSSFKKVETLSSTNQGFSSELAEMMTDLKS